MTDGSSTIMANLVADIKEILDSCNPYVQNFRMLRQHMTSPTPPNIKMLILGKRGKDRRCYNLPTAFEVAGLIVGDFDVNSSNRDIVVQTQCGEPQRLSASYLPLQ